MCVCVCVCVCERERERESVSVYACVYVCCCCCLFCFLSRRGGVSAGIAVDSNSVTVVQKLCQFYRVKHCFFQTEVFICFIKLLLSSLKALAKHLIVCSVSIALLFLSIYLSVCFLVCFELPVCQFLSLPGSHNDHKMNALIR